MNWYFAALSKYATFDGRARRKEYWIFGLINAVILFILEMVMMSTIKAGHSPTVSGALLLIFALAILLPSISVMVRRLHDTDRSGWWYWIALVPVIGGIVLLVFTLLDGTPGSNQYGPSPKSATI